MFTDQLDEFLKIPTNGEKWHLENPGVLSNKYKEIPIIHKSNQDCYYFDFSNTLKNQNMAIVKESRYTTIPPHFHRDMELNYIYSGSCDFLINGQEIHMDEGDLCILDSNVVHSATSIKKENDIVINFVFKKNFFNSVFLSRLSNKGIVTNFLYGAISSTQKHDRYLIFHTYHNERFKLLIQFILTEYFFPSTHDKELIDVYASAMFIELLNCEYKTQYKKNKKEYDKVLPIMDYIQRNYKECTLESVADIFCYSPNYLSSLLKKLTGKTFAELKLEQQIIEIAFLLRNSNMTINQCIEKVGGTNYNYFYKKFKETYGITPKQYR